MSFFPLGCFCILCRCTCNLAVTATSAGLVIRRLSVSIPPLKAVEPLGKDWNLH